MDSNAVKKMDEPARREECAKHLIAHGWTPEIAGEDWDAAVAAFSHIIMNPGYGIVVTGAFGCGKTSFIHAIGGMHTLNLGDRTTLDWLNPKAEGCGIHYYKVLNESVLLDDLGAESAYNEYGTSRELAGEFIFNYHKHHIEDHAKDPKVNAGRFRPRLYITTNLTPEELMKRYTGRVTDRLKDLCVPLTFKGSSKRHFPHL